MFHLAWNAPIGEAGVATPPPLSIPSNFSKRVADSLNVFSLAVTLDIFLKVNTEVSDCNLNKVSEFQFLESIAFSGVMLSPAAPGHSLTVANDSRPYFYSRC